MTKQPPLIVLDDDPTGAQSEVGVPVALTWEPQVLARIAATGPRAVHLLTNCRALAAPAAEVVTREAAGAAVGAFPGAPIFLRGDSTLRAHLLPEYRGLRDAAFAGREPTLVLVPALPGAGRVTEGGVHYLRCPGERVPVAATEYARDRDFGYLSSRLLAWAEERSGGAFDASRGRELRLAELREGGPDAVAAALGELAEVDGAAALALDSVSVADLELVAAGLRRAFAAGAEAIVRCAPALVGAFAGTRAEGAVEPPAVDGPVLVLCGSHVPTSSRQLERLLARHPASAVWVRPARLAGAGREAEVAAAIDAAAARLRGDGLAVVATERDVYAAGDSLAAGAAIATGLAAILAGLRDRVGLVVSKGGITSAVNVREGLAADLAEVRGPLRDGISLWSIDTPERSALPFVVFPGNVGGEDDLAELVDQIAVAA
ncbi:MAG TPA: four-carbon acid sugar kinase family protein [Solirubrobacterales bacterium]|nr:four-carbon acid sugar kinase family protein [Solirubrobacterales bacterium]